MSGVVAILLRPQDAQCALLRGLARELLACAVLRPVMNFASPGLVFAMQACQLCFGLFLENKCMCVYADMLRHVFALLL